MASCTETIYDASLPASMSAAENEQSSKVIVFSLRANPAYEGIIDRIATIIKSVGFEMYDTYKDPLSTLILKWANRVVSLNLAKKPISDDALVQIVKCLKVLKSFFVDSLSNLPLTDPVLVKETGWICERVFIERAELSGVELVTHKFAKLLLEELESIDIWGSEVPHSYEDWTYEAYRSIARLQFMKFRCKNYSQNSSKTAEAINTLLEAAKKRSDANLKLVREAHQKETQALKERLQAARSESREMYAQKQKEIDALNEKADRLRVENLALAIQSVFQEQEIAQIRQQNIFDAQELERLRQRVEDDDDGFCTIS